MRGRALILATSQYQDKALARLPLPSTRIDAQGLSAVLKDPEIGNFEVTECLDLPWPQWRVTIADFFGGKTRDELLLLYISGHGVKDDAGRLYFAAADTDTEKLIATGIPAGFIHEAASPTRRRPVVILLDTCFSGAYTKGLHFKGNAPQAVNFSDYYGNSAGTAVIAASGAIEHAQAGDPESAQASLFTKHLIEGLRTGEADRDADGYVSLDDLFKHVSIEVQHETRSQRPERCYFGLTGDLVIASNPRPRPAQLPPELIGLLQHADYRVRLVAVGDLEHLATGSSRPLALAARQALERLVEDDSQAVAVSRAAASALQQLGIRPQTASGAVSALTPLSSRRPGPAPASARLSATVQPQRPAQPAGPSASGHRVGESFRDGTEGFCPEMVVVPPGRFQMGSPANEAGRFDNEGPVHEVTIGYAFAVSKHPITRGQWRAYLAASGRTGSMGAYGFNPSTNRWEQKPEYSWQNPGFPQEDSHPVVCVTWNEVRDYAAWLSERTSQRYRLLSEAEHEYVNRAGSRTAYFWREKADDAPRYANVSVPAVKARYPYTSPVGSFEPNAFGLHDTTGNVWCWTQDCWKELPRRADRRERLGDGGLPPPRAPRRLLVRLTSRLPGGVPQRARRQVRVQRPGSSARQDRLVTLCPLLSSPYALVLIRRETLPKRDVRAQGIDPKSSPLHRPDLAPAALSPQTCASSWQRP